MHRMMVERCFEDGIEATLSGGNSSHCSRVRREMVASRLLLTLTHAVTSLRKRTLSSCLAHVHSLWGLQALSTGRQASGHHSRRRTRGSRCCCCSLEVARNAFVVKQDWRKVTAATSQRPHRTALEPQGPAGKT